LSRTSRIPGFYRLDVAHRRQRLASRAALDQEALGPLDSGGLDLESADHMIENAIGTYALPMGVALNFLVDEVDYVVPMAIEEPSVVAAASHAAVLVRAGGGFHTEASAPIMVGQIQLLDVAEPDAAAAAIAAEREALLAHARGLTPRLVARGGGATDLEVRILSRPGQPDGGMLVVHVHIDCRDAMGANLVNTVAERLAPALARIAGGRIGLRILSNLCDRRLVTVRARVPDRVLAPEEGASPGQGIEVRRRIAAASRFAELDPYRAATHNKGVMNGIDAVLLATGNDWRGVEAGAHAYACRGGRYAPLARWTSDEAGRCLVGELTMPLAAGTLGGAIAVHRGAQLALALLAVDSSTQLASVIASVGLASNLAALRALATDGIQRGHMALHARVVARAAGATGDLIQRVAAEMAAVGDVKPARAREILERLAASDLAGDVTLKEQP
jgi:hydroxymethylglutaryl-CoA reductase